MSVSAEDTPDPNQPYKDVIKAVEDLTFNEANSSSLLQEFAMPAGSNPGGNGDTYSVYQSWDKEVINKDKIEGQFKYVVFEPFNPDTGYTDYTFTGIMTENVGEKNDTVQGDSCMKLVDAETLATHTGLGSQAVQVLNDHESNNAKWGGDKYNNTIRYTLDGKTQRNGIYLYDIGIL